MKHRCIRVFLALNLPGGIAIGVITVMLPFVITRAGLSVGTAASVVAIGLAPLSMRILWAPIADLTLTYKAWYRIGAMSAALMLLLISTVPISLQTVWLLAGAAFTLKAGTTLAQLPAAGLMALAVPKPLQGRAAAYFQIGAKVGTGLGGGAGVWMAYHFGGRLAGGAVLAAACVASIGALAFVREPERPVNRGAFRTRLASVGSDLWAIIRSRRGAFVLAVVITPIGAGAASNLWSAVAPEWHVAPNTIALVSGVGATVASTLGCLFAGWWADRADRRLVFLSTGAVMALVGAAVAAGPRLPVAFVVGTLAYSGVGGMCDAAYSALILSVIGGTAAASQYTVLTALGNLPNSYMTALDGHVHDKWGTAAMLGLEALLGGALVAAAAAVVRKQPRIPPEPPA